MKAGAPSPPAIVQMPMTRVETLLPCSRVGRRVLTAQLQALAFLSQAVFASCSAFVFLPLLAFATSLVAA